MNVGSVPGKFHCIKKNYGKRVYQNENIIGNSEDECLCYKNTQQHL